MPGTQASATEVAGYVARHRDGFIAALTVYALGMGLFLVFAAGVWRWLEARGASAAAFGLGSVSLATLVYAGFVPMLALAYRHDAVTPETARTLYDLCFGLLALSGIPTAVAMGAFAAIVLRERLLPAVTGWLAALAAVAHVVIVGSFLPESGFFSLEGGVIVAIPVTLFAWLAVTSIALTRAQR